MNATNEHTDWVLANESYLREHLDRLRGVMERARSASGEYAVEIEASAAAGDAAKRGDVDADGERAPELRFPLDGLCSEFGLSNFERDLLLMCAGIELDAAFAALCAETAGNQGRVNFGLALDVLEDAHWSALLPDRPLRRWRLIEVIERDVLVRQALRIPERVLHFLLGFPAQDALFAAISTAIPEPEDETLSPSRAMIRDQIVALWDPGHETAVAPSAVQLYGEVSADKRAIAASAAARCGLHLRSIAPQAIPAAIDEQENLARLWERESVLGNVALYLELPVGTERGLTQIALDFLERLGVPRVLAAPDVIPAARMVRMEVAKPGPEEQRNLWRRCLGTEAAALNGRLDAITSQFHLGSDHIQLASRIALSEARGADNGADFAGILWKACCSLARPAMEDLAMRIDALATWEDLVLPPLQTQILRDVAMQVKHRARVYEEWGFGNRSNRGLGISALFSGPSGTGKTMAAEVLARELGLDLYRIDLSSVVSKYIGETEKNLRRVFDAAEGGGAILLFDEADALFGKRSEVKDSHDRHANIEVSYLLQRMESYRGLAILTTNLKSSLDTAFLRRIRFIVQFPFPDATHREEIWRRIFPQQAPLGDLNFQQLARLNVAGGNIKNIAMSAAFIAADQDEALNMRHLMQAAKNEYTKIEKTISSAEFRDWDKAEARA